MMEYVNLIGIVAGVIGGLWTIFKVCSSIYARISPRVRSGIDNMLGLKDLRKQAAKLDRIEEVLADVASELKPNGGFSLRDSINRIEKGQTMLEQRQIAILADSQAGVFEVDAKGQCNWANRKFLRMTGRTLFEVKGHGWVNIIHPDDREKVEEEWFRAIDEEREFTMSFRILDPEGGVEDTQCRTFKMVESDGKTLGYLVRLSLENGSSGQSLRCYDETCQ